MAGLCLSDWGKPVVSSIILPAHAQTSSSLIDIQCEATGQVLKFPSGSVNILIDLQTVLVTVTDLNGTPIEGITVNYVLNAFDVLEFTADGRNEQPIKQIATGALITDANSEANATPNESILLQGRLIVTPIGTIRINGRVSMVDVEFSSASPVYVDNNCSKRLYP